MECRLPFYVEAAICIHCHLMANLALLGTGCVELCSRIPKMDANNSINIIDFHWRILRPRMESVHKVYKYKNKNSRFLSDAKQREELLVIWRSF